MDVVTAQGLRRRFGTVDALAGVDLAVPAGSVHGLLGPNGAGKTTLVRILTTLLRPTGGTATVAGFDVGRDPDRVRANIGLVGQHAAVDEILSGRQNLEMFGRLYHLGAAEARQRASDLLSRFGLADTGSRAVSTYSGGMRRRLDLAASLITAPPVLFLDEPTTGLDPRSRTEVWDAVRTLVAAGTTVLLTTQYLEEVDRLADHVTVIDHGTVVASGTPAALKSQLGGDRIDLVVAAAADLPAAAALLERITGNTPDTSVDDRRVGVAVADRMAALTAVVRGLGDAGIAVEDVTLRRPTLDEVFLHLTGRERVAA
ncbi:ABC-2 type transport system ATP-binding protein [Asanoa ferruginea]|uniref:ABC-2 type transport system ATP-binding protein n=1 Tax=Asanoa ferruginea TaxID=53367 RepID=A0A3D9ZU20_9ACTN|nr:ATP-binding cassette domain-containing protein [Asanoa ferruginea]REG00658.1 ABC-2 type transport system ATP-binding protein [Asanoa ferruginea]GIF47822.1 daunorubicin resistance protein DrrA family ABC transporter ATP-binding protein [Asanoa ferruginea]